MTSGDTAALARLLAEDAVLHSDGGAKRAAAQRNAVAYSATRAARAVSVLDAG